MNSFIPGDTIAGAFSSLLDVTVENVPVATGRTGRAGTRLVLSGAQLPTFNGVFSLSATTDVDAVSELAADLAEYPLPWSILTRTEPSPELLALAETCGLTAAHRSPVMARTADPVRPWPGGRDAPSVRKLTGADEKPYTDLLATSFGVPASIFGDLMSAPVLDSPTVTGYLVEHHGEPVATGFGILAGGLVGVYNIGTPPALRSRGYGRLATEAVMSEGFAAGATGAYLLASEMGRPLYRSLGFETVETWTYLSAE